MVPFGGWDMPIQYPTGTLVEHRACRSDAAAFDVSHLGTVRVAGPGAFDRLQAALTNDLGKIGPGRAQYTHLLDEADASVLDDIIVWWVTDDRFDVMPNASNTERVLEALGGDDVTAGRAIIAVQGPRARERLATVAPAAAAVGRFRVAEVDVLGRPSVVAGTGYTGEDGVELAVDADHAAAVWDAVVDAGVTPAGLGRATRCGSRPGFRSTATSWAQGSRPCRRVSAGWWRGTRASSGVASPSPSSGSGVSSGRCGAWRSRGGARRGPTRRSRPPARRSAG